MRKFRSGVMENSLGVKVAFQLSPESEETLGHSWGKVLQTGDAYAKPKAEKAYSKRVMDRRSARPGHNEQEKMVEMAGEKWMEAKSHRAF